MAGMFLSAWNTNKCGNMALWLSWLERRAVNANVVSSSLTEASINPQRLALIFSYIYLCTLQPAEVYGVLAQ